MYRFLAALSSSRCLVVSLSVGRSVGWSYIFVKSWPLEYQIDTKTYQKPTYLPTYLPTYIPIYLPTYLTNYVTVVMVVTVMIEVTLVKVSE